MPYEKLPNGSLHANWLTEEERLAAVARREARGDLGPVVIPRFIARPPAGGVVVRRRETPAPQASAPLSAHASPRNREDQ